jgi:hypothetical protein
VPEDAAPASRDGSSSAFLFFLAALLIGAGLLAWNATRPYVDWPNTSDDMFYYLTLARETAEHGVVSVDGLRPTNGFHPLWFLVLRALVPWTAEASLPQVALAILATCHALTCLVLWRTLRRLAGPGLAGLLAGLYAANPFLLRVVFAGVESALAALGVSVCLWAHLRWLERGRAADRTLSLAALVLAVAARTDTVMLAAAFALAPAIARLRERAGAGRALRAVDPVPVVIAALPVLAFGIWSLSATGEFLQTSGRALSYWQSIGDWRLIRSWVAGLGAVATPAAALLYALEVVVQWVGWITRAPLELLIHHPLGVVTAALVVAARFGLLPGAASRPAGVEPDLARGRLAIELVTFQILLWTFYALLFRHCQVWYWHSSLVAAALLAAIWLAPAREIARRFAARLAPRPVMALLLIAAIGCTVWSVSGFRPRPRGPGAAVWPPAAGEPLARVPAGATLAAFDTGRLGWEHPHLTVVNLDGLVNNAAYRALRARAIGRYMLDQRIEWLYVRDPVVERFRAFGLDAWLSRADPVAGSADGVRLYRLRTGG